LENLERPNYYAIITAEVRYSREITANAKLLYAEITALANKSGKCWASNKYFAELYGVQPTRISEWVKQLEAAGFVSTKINSGGLRAITPRTLLEKQKTPSGKAEGTLLEKQKSGSSVTTSVPNNTSNNKKNKVDEFGGVDTLLFNLISLVNPKEKVTADRIRALNGRLKDYTPEEIINAARAFSKSKWHRENKQMSIDNLLAPSKFGRWHSQADAPGTPEAPVPDYYEDETGKYWKGEKITPENQDRIVKERMEG
jgi:hypothetical protein